MSTTETEFRTAITPSEAVMLYGDRVLGSSSWLPLSSVRTLTSGRWVERLSLLEAAMATLVAALVASREIVATVQVKQKLWSKSTQLDLRLVATVNRWPAGSPEARLVDWLARQPARSGRCMDGIIELFMPDRLGHVWITAFNSLHDGLLERGYVMRKMTYILKFIPRRTIVLVERHRGDLERFADLIERTHLALPATLPPEVDKAARDDWYAAYRKQDIDMSA